MTAKEKVLKLYPEARARKWGGWRDGESGWVIEVGAISWRVTGAGETEEAAWQNAAESLPAQPELKRKPIKPCVGDPAGTGFCEFHECENDCQSVESLPVEANSPEIPDSSTAEDSRKKYLPWQNAGGPNECKHGYAAGIPCPDCDSVAEPKPTPSTPAEPLSSADKWDADIENKRIAFIAELEAALGTEKTMHAAWRKRAEECEAKPQPASISSEPMPEQLVSEEYLQRTVKFFNPDSNIYKAAVEIQQWRKWAAAKGSTDTEGR